MGEGGGCGCPDDLSKKKRTFLAKYLKSSVVNILPSLQSTLKKGFRQLTTTLESCKIQSKSKRKIFLCQQLYYYKLQKEHIKLIVLNSSRQSEHKRRKQ